MRNRTLTPADVPTTDVRDSYIENCTLTGDWSGFDFRNVSAFNCTFQGDFRNIQHQYMTSVRCNWRQAQLPADVSSYKHDMVIAVLAQALSRLRRQRRAAVQKVIDNVGLDYQRSWYDSIKRLIQESGLTLTQVRNWFEDAFAGYPKLVDRIRETTAKDLSIITGYNIPPLPTELPLALDGEEIDLLTDARIAGEDRWAIERTLETPRTRVHIYTLHPVPWVAVGFEGAISPERWARWDWWFNLPGFD